MPALPWTTFSPPDPARDYVAMASRLPLARYWDLPAFLSATLAIRAQLASASGLIGYALDAHLARKTFFRLGLGEPGRLGRLQPRGPAPQPRQRHPSPDAAHHVHVLDRIGRRPAYQLDGASARQLVAENGGSPDALRW